jgi:hypothetical protein
MEFDKMSVSVIFGTQAINISSFGNLDVDKRNVVCHKHDFGLGVEFDP